MAIDPAGLLVVFTYFGAVALSLPAAAAVLLAARRMGVVRAGVLVGLVVLLLVAAAAAALGATVGLVSGLTFAASAVAALLLLWVVPVALGRWIVRRLEGVGGDVALGYAVAGLPVAMIASALVFVAPGGPSRYNITFLSGPALWTASAVFLAVVLVGPGLAGVGLLRLAGRRR